MADDTETKVLETPSTLLKKRRGCFGSLVSGGCGCFAFLVGSAFAVVLAAPQLLSGWGARVIEGVIQSQVDGDVEVAGVDLSWSEPQSARSVVIRDSEGLQVIQGTLRFPSLLELLTSDGPERELRIVVTSLNARIAQDGTSDLGRMFGLDADDGRTAIRALADAGGRILRRTPTSADPDQVDALRMTLIVSEARFEREDDTEASAIVENLVLVATSRPDRSVVRIRECSIRGPGIEGRAEVKMNAHFESTADGDRGQRLASLSLDVDEIPGPLLRRIGILPRRAPSGAPASTDRRPATTAGRPRVLDELSTQLGDGAAEFFESGAAIHVRYGSALGRSSANAAGSANAGDPANAGGLANAEGPANAGGGAVATGKAEAGEHFVAVTTEDPNAARALAVDLSGDLGELHLRAVHDGDLLVASSAEGTEAALHGGFRLRPGYLKRAIERIAPDGVVVADGKVDARWYFKSRSFSLPLPSAWLSPPETVAARDERQALRLSAGREWARHLGASTMDLALQSVGDDRAKATVGTPGGEVLTMQHRVTRFDLHGTEPGSIVSSWGVDEATGGVARLTVNLPAARSQERPAGQPSIDLRLEAVPDVLFATIAPLPDELAILMPDRLPKLKLMGLPLPGSSLPGQARASRTVEVDVWTSETDHFHGTYTGGAFLCPRGRVELELSPDVCDAVLARFLPWCERIKPAEAAGRVLIDMSDFSFRTAEGAMRESGRLTITPGPIRIKLRKDLAQGLTTDDDVESEEAKARMDWIEWSPKPIELTVEPNMIRYTDVELPLSDDYVRSMVGTFDRLTGRYTLEGLIDSGVFSGADQSTGVVDVIITGGDRPARVAIERGDLDEAVRGLVDRANRK